MAEAVAAIMHAVWESECYLEYTLSWSVDNWHAGPSCVRLRGSRLSIESERTVYMQGRRPKRVTSLTWNAFVSSFPFLTALGETAAHATGAMTSCESRWQ